MNRFEEYDDCDGVTRFLEHALPHFKLPGVCLVDNTLRYTPESIIKLDPATQFIFVEHMADFDFGIGVIDSNEKFFVHYMCNPYPREISANVESFINYPIDTLVHSGTKWVRPLNRLLRNVPEQQFFWLIAKACYHIHGKQRPIVSPALSHDTGAFLDNLCDVAMSRGISEADFWIFWAKQQKLFDAANLLIS